jgi:hypothetical protein
MSKSITLKKIICTDNFDKDYIPDTLVGENIPEWYAEQIKDFLNMKLSSNNSPNFYRCVNMDYVLKKSDI